MRSSVTNILQKVKAAVGSVRERCRQLVERYNSHVKRYSDWQKQPHNYRHAEYDDEVECKNCGRQYKGDYCPECGQAADTPRITFRSMILRTLDVWGFGNRSMPRSLLHLLLRPGYMITDYIEGRRQPYFPPIKMMFVLGAIYLLLLAAISTGSKIMHSDKTMTDVVLDYIGISAPETVSPVERDTTIEVVNGVADGENADLSADILGQILADDTTQIQTKSGDKDVKLRLDENSALVKSVRNHGTAQFSKALDALMAKTLVPRLFVLSLLYALMTKAFFRRSPRCQQYNFTEMFFAQILIFCQMLVVAIALTCFGVKNDLSSFTLLPWWLHVLILTIDYKQMFGVSRRSALIRTALLTLVVDIIMVLVLCLVMLAMVLSMFQVA